MLQHIRQLLNRESLNASFRGLCPLFRLEGFPDPAYPQLRRSSHLSRFDSFLVLVCPPPALSCPTPLKEPVFVPRMVPASVAAAHAIPPQTLTRLAREWLQEDTPNFDPAGACVGSREVEASLLCKTAHSVLAGSPFFNAVFQELGCSVHWLLQEGSESGNRRVPGSVGARGSDVWSTWNTAPR